MYTYSGGSQRWPPRPSGSRRPSESRRPSHCRPSGRSLTALWEQIEPILREFWPKKPTGRRVANWRKVLNGIIFRMRSGCQWDQLPSKFGPKSTVHDWFQRWSAGGIMERIWRVLTAACDELGGVDWQWQAADACLGKARFGGKKDNGPAKG